MNFRYTSYLYTLTCKLRSYQKMNQFSPYLITAEQPTVYEVTISTFNDELRSPYHSLPLYCSISPQPDEPLFYGWKHSVYNQYVSTTATSPYAYYKPLFNHPRYGRVFCHVETEERFLGTGSILLEAQGRRQRILGSIYHSYFDKRTKRICYTFVSNQIVSSHVANKLCFLTLQIQHRQCFPTF